LRPVRANARPARHARGARAGAAAAPARRRPVSRTSGRPAGPTLRDARRARRRRLPLVSASVLGVVLVATNAFAWTVRYLDENIRSHDIETLLGTDRPSAAESDDPTDPHAGRPLDILLVGVDDREGDNARFGGAGQTGVRSDTVI